MNITMEIKARDFNEIKKVVAQLYEIQKEYSCNCTLSVIPTIPFICDTQANTGGTA